MRRSAVLGLATAGIAGGVALVATDAGRERSSLIAKAKTPGRIRLIDGERIHYRDEGSGPAIVLIHGLGGSTYSWRSTIAGLSSDYRVIALDLPGFGFSERQPVHPLSLDRHARRVARLMDELEIQRAIVMGHSMGGAVASRLAVAWPERVERLVLVSSTHAGEIPPWQRPGNRARSPLYLVDFGLRMPRLTRLVGKLVVRNVVFEGAQASDELVRRYCEPLLLPGTGACLRRLFDDTVTEQPIDLAGVSAPTLVINGAADRGCPPGLAARIAASIPGARVMVIEQAGHLVAEEQPEAFLACVREFLAEGPGPSAAEEAPVALDPLESMRFADGPGDSPVS